MRRALVATRPGELLAATFGSSPGSAEPAIVGRALLYRLGPTLNLEETTLLLDARQLPPRYEVRSARVQWRFADDEDALAALEAPPHLSRKTERREWPAGRCGMIDHMEIVTKCGTPEEVDAFLARTETQSKAALHHHHVLFRVRSNVAKRRRQSSMPDCVIL